MTTAFTPSISTEAPAGRTPTRTVRSLAGAVAAGVAAGLGSGAGSGLGASTAIEDAGGWALLGGLEALCSIGGEHAVRERRGLGADPGGEVLNRRRRLRADGDDETAQSIDVLERRSAGESLVENRAERPDVGALIDLL